MPLLTEGCVTEGSANKLSKQYHPYGSPPGKRGVKENTKSSHSDNSITYISESISPQFSASSVLPQANPVLGYATDTFSPHYGTSTLPPFKMYRHISQFRLICLPPHICIFQVPCRCRLINRLLPSRSKLPAITRTVWVHINFPVAMIPRIQDMGLLSYPPSPYGYYPPQPLPVGYPLSASTAAAAQHKHRGMVKFLVRNHLRFSSTTFSSSVFKFCFIKVCRFRSSLIFCLLSGFHNLVFLL